MKNKLKLKLYLKIFSLPIWAILIFCGIIACHASKRPSMMCGVASIKVTPESADINSGDTVQFTAIGTFSNGLTQDITSFVTWNSSNTVVATIAANGLATGVLPGLPALISANLPSSCPHSLTSNFATFTDVPRFAYVANEGLLSQPPSVSVCNVNSTNGLFISPCADSGGSFTHPSNVVVNKFGGQTFAYVTDNYFGTQHIVWQCRIDPATGLFGTSCVDATAGTFTFNAPIGMVFYQAGNGNTYAYVTNSSYTLNNNSVSKCLVNLNTGAFSECGDSGAGAIFSHLAGINYRTTGSQTFFYLPEGDAGGAGSSIIAKCPVNSNGDLSNVCTTLTTGFSGSENIAFFSKGSNQNYAFVSQFNAIFVSRCTIDSQGSFTPQSCSNVTAGVAFDEVDSNVFIAIGNTIFVYINDPLGDLVWQCELDSATLNLMNCMDSGVGATFHFPVLNTAFY